VSQLRGRQFYYDEAGAVPMAKTIIPNGPSITSANGDSPPVAGAADHGRQRASG